MIEWISCKKMLPGKCGDYLVTMADRRVKLCTFIIGDGRVPDWWCGYEMMVPRSKVIAWAELPTPYRPASWKNH